MRKNIATINLDTGELLEGIPIWVGRKPNNPYGNRFFMANQDASLQIAQDKSLTAEPLHVLFYLFARLDFENFIHVPQTEIVQALEMDKSNASKAIRLLIDKGILIRGPKVGRSYSLRLNPNYGWKGKVKHLRRSTKTGHLEVVGGKDRKAKS